MFFLWQGLIVVENEIVDPRKGWKRGMLMASLSWQLIDHQVGAANHRETNQIFRTPDSFHYGVGAHMIDRRGPSAAASNFASGVVKLGTDLTDIIGENILHLRMVQT